MKRIVISQPRYLPAINFIQRLYFAEDFVLFDNVQRTPRSIENRNKILLNGSEHWMTIPIASPSREWIKNSRVDRLQWVEDHKKTLYLAYHKHPFFDRNLIEKYYEGVEGDSYVEITTKLLGNLCKMFHFEPHLVFASLLDMDHSLAGPEKLLEICEILHADIYVSGSNGRNYGVKEYFMNRKREIRVVFHDFEFPEYHQYNNKGRFIPWICFFDQIFNLGLEQTEKIIKSNPVFNEK